VRDVLAFLGAIYGAVVGGTAASAVLMSNSGFGRALRFGVPATSGLALMGLGITAYCFYKFASDD
jgi:hypothetical protein